MVANRKSQALAVAALAGLLGLPVAMPAAVESRQARLSAPDRHPTKRGPGRSSARSHRGGAGIKWRTNKIAEGPRTRRAAIARGPDSLNAYDRAMTLFLEGKGLQPRRRAGLGDRPG